LSVLVNIRLPVSYSGLIHVPFVRFKKDEAGKIRQDNPAFRGAGMDLRDNRAFTLSQIRVYPRASAFYFSFCAFCAAIFQTPLGIKIAFW